MLVEKLLVRSSQNLGVPAAKRLLEDLDEARWALDVLHGLAAEDESGGLVKRFERWRVDIEERRAHVAAIYLHPFARHGRPDVSQMR
jgi:hypothetical protein